MAFFFSEDVSRGVIGEVRCGFLQIYAPTPYSAVFSRFMHLHLIVRFSYYMHLHLRLLRSILVQCGVDVVLQFGLDSFGSDWANANVNFNIKNPHLQQLKNLTNYNLQI
jgi:hypothetical protein